MVKNSIIYTIGNLLPKIIVFLMIPIYTSYLSPDDYGVINTINAVIGVLSIIFFVTMNYSITRSLIDLDLNEQKRFILSNFIFLIVNATFFIILLLILKRVLSPIFLSGISVDPFYSRVVYLSALSIFSIIPLGKLRIEEKAVKYVLLNILDTFLTVIFTIILVIGFKQGAIGAVNALLFSKIIMAFVYTFFILKFINFKIRIVNYGYIISSVLLCLPIFPHYLAGWINNLSDRIILGKFVDLKQIGIYSLGAQFSTAFLLLINSFNQAYTPRFFRKMKNNEINQTYFSNLLKLTLSVFVIIAVLAILLLPIVINTTTNKNYHFDYGFSGYLIGGMIFQLCYMLAVAPLIYYKKTQYVMFCTVTAALLNIIINLLIVPIWGILGASITTLFSYFIQFILARYFCNKLSKGVFVYKVKDIVLNLIVFFIYLILSPLITNYILKIVTALFAIILIIYPIRKMLLIDFDKLIKNTSKKSTSRV